MSRTANTLRNIKTAVIGQVLGMLISFITRKVFVMTLSAEYLGIEGLFTNILSILALSELGIGTSLIYSMYKPLADGDKEKIKSLMQLYKKAYTVIGVFILVVGIGLTPFIQFFINGKPDIPESLYAIYIMYVVNSGVSYFFTYKRSLIIANQRRDIATVYRYGMYIVMNVAQMVVLITTGNFYLYLGIMICNTLLENILLSRKANKMFPYIKEKNVKELEKSDTREIKKNVFALMCHKLGGVVVNGTDNLLISKLVGIIEVGLYSNYALVIKALNTVMGLLFQSITASFGNLNAETDDAKKESVFNRINFITFWLIGFCSIMLVTLLNPFITVWLGESYCGDMMLVLIIVFNFFLKEMRQPVLMARDAMGLYWHDRYKPIVESAVNLITSIILGKMIGMVGIFMGTAISTLTTNLWVEPLVLYRHGFKSKASKYFKKYMLYFIQIAVNMAVTYKICSFIRVETFIDLIIMAALCAVISNLIFLCFNCRNKQFRECFDLAKRILRRKGAKS